MRSARLDRQGRHRHRFEQGAGSGERARAGRGRLPRHDLRARRGGAGRGGGRAAALPAGGPERVLAVTADLSTAEGVETVVARTVETFGGLDILVNNVGARQGRRHRRHDRRRVAGGVRSDAVSGHPRLAAGRAADAQARRRRDRHDCVDLGPRIGRPHDLQRRQSRRNQPGEGDGAAAGARQHPRQQRGAGIDSFSGGIVGSPRSGGS